MTDSGHGADLFEQLRALLPPAAPVDAGTVDAAPADKGAYALLMRLASSAPFPRGGTIHRFAPGTYVYAGSAYGPGGIRARLRRHLRRDKKPHWHVDHLTGRAAPVIAIPFIDGSECEIIACLTQTGLFRVPLTGFGSSDCATCPSHLLEYRPRA